MVTGIADGQANGGRVVIHAQTIKACSILGLLATTLAIQIKVFIKVRLGDACAFAAKECFPVVAYPHRMKEAVAQCPRVFFFVGNSPRARNLTAARIALDQAGACAMQADCLARNPQAGARQLGGFQQAVLLFSGFLGPIGDRSLCAACGMCSARRRRCCRCSRRAYHAYVQRGLVCVRVEGAGHFCKIGNRGPPTAGFYRERRNKSHVIVLIRAAQRVALPTPNSFQSMAQPPVDESTPDTEPHGRVWITPAQEVARLKKEYPNCVVGGGWHEGGPIWVAPIYMDGDRQMFGLATLSWNCGIRPSWAPPPKPGDYRTE